MCCMSHKQFVAAASFGSGHNSWVATTYIYDGTQHGAYYHSRFVLLPSLLILMLMLLRLPLLLLLLLLMLLLLLLLLELLP